MKVNFCFNKLCTLTRIIEKGYWSFIEFIQNSLIKERKKTIKFTHT